MYLIQILIRFIFCHLLFWVKFENRNIAKHIGKCVVFSNHPNFSDPFILFSDISNLAIMAKAELFKNKIIGKIFMAFGVFPIHRGEKDVKSLLHAVRILENEKHNKLLIFPEGTRVKNNDEKKQAKIGAVYIAMKAKVPILPVKITMKDKDFFTKITVTYGDPVMLDFDRSRDKEYMQQMTDEILDKLYSYS